MTNGHPPQDGQPQPDGYPQGQPPQPSAYPEYPQQQGNYGQYPQAPNPYQRGPSGPRATFWQRLGAYVLDIIIVLVPMLVLFGLLGVFDDLGDNPNQFQSFDGANILTTLIGLVITLSYFSLLEGSPSGQTVGKKALGIRVIDQHTGGSIGFARALGRNSVRALPSYLPLVGWFWGLLDHLWMLWDKENQALHDKVVKTFVVPVAAYPIQITDPGQQQSFGQQSHQQGYGGQPPGYGPPPGGPAPHEPPPGHNPNP